MTRTLVIRRPLALLGFVTAAAFAQGREARSEPPPEPPSRTAAVPALRFTDETPDAMIDDATARALASTGGRGAELAQLSALATISTLAQRAERGRALAAFERIATSPEVTADVRGDAALLGRTLAPVDATDGAGVKDEQLGVVAAVSVLGPFRDTGGGLDAHDGPEASGRAFADARARYSWGTYEVSWRAVPRAFATARGVPLDVFVSPRKESCTWVATKLVVETAQKIVVRIASSGQVRLLFDGTDVGRDQAVNEGCRFERIAARVNAPQGTHLLAAKVCSGALEDEGRVRLRVSDETGRWPNGVSASADLTGAPSPPQRQRPAKTNFDRATTPLARVLAESSKTREEQLESAVVRALGGADDLRSPRAPGILASLSESAAIDGDTLAMAAWVSSSGANRSAWLVRARSNGSSDVRTRAFVARRLVERHIEAGLSDWAMAELRGARIDTAGDAEGALLAAQVDLALGTEALRLRAMRRLAAGIGVRPTAPDALLEAFAETAGPYDPLAALAARERLDARGTGGSNRVLAAQARGAAAVIVAARRAFAGGVATADQALSVAQTVGRTGAHDEARGFYELLSRWAPNRAGVWAGLAQQTAAGQPDASRDQAIAAALRRARELEPTEARYRSELSLRTRAAPSGEARDDEKYLASSQTILARRVGIRALNAGATVETRPGPDRAAGLLYESEAPDVADRQLHWLRAVVMHPDRRVSELVHYAREIVIAPRTEDELNEDIPSEGELTEILRARVHRRDGSIEFPLEEANDNAHPRIRWPELGPGDVVEVAFRSWTGGPVGGRGDPPFYRLDYAGALSTHPVLYNEVIVESPADRPIFVGVVNGKPERREENDDGERHVTRLVWERPRNVPDEPLAPPLSETIPTVVLSTFKDWNAFRSWYGEAVRGFTEPDAQVRELAAKLTAGKSSRESKLRALFEFVADDIRYVNYVSGEWWLPNRPQQLLARREGDCDDKALLLITLLRVVGIEAQEVLVQTRLTGQPSIVRARGAAIPLFDHGIAFLPGPNGGTYLDATSPQSRLGPLPSMDARAVALRMDGPGEIVELPSSSPDDHGVDATWTIALRADGGADLKGQERALGDDAFWMRSYLTEPGARVSWVEEHLVGGWFPTIEVDKNVEFRGDLPRGAATVDWKARSSGLAHHEGDELVVPLSPSQTLASQLAPLVRRTLPVWLPPHIAPRRESRAIRVIAPKGFAFEALPPGGEENGGAFGHARLEMAQDPANPHAVLVRRTVVFDSSRIGVEEYPNWRAWVQRVDALMRRSVRLVPTAGASR